MTSAKLERLLNRNYEVKIGEYISRGFGVYLSNLGGFIGLSFLTTLITIILNFIPGLGNIASSVLGAGFTFVGLAIIRRQTYTFKDFFKGLSNKYFLRVFLVSLVGMAITVLGLILWVLPGIYISVCYVFALQIAIDWELDFWEALEASRKLISRNWFSMFGFVLVLGSINPGIALLVSVSFFFNPRSGSITLDLINLVGAVFLGISIFLAPLTICAQLVAYDDIIGNSPDPIPSGMDL